MDDLLLQATKRRVGLSNRNSTPGRCMRKSGMNLLGRGKTVIKKSLCLALKR
jgi:hypothetical protein